MSNGILYVVATPIGNLGDITIRALEVLKSVDLILCEDTRKTRKLLSFYKISKGLISCHKFNEEMRVHEVLELLKEEKKIALLSEAGTPCISDPGARMVEAASKSGFKIIPIPGASSLTTILSLTDCEIKNFTFIGFVPRKMKDRESMLGGFKKSGEPFIFFESPRRINETLKSLFLSLGEREIILGRELTKLNEEILRINLHEVISEQIKIFEKGEIVVLVKPTKESCPIVNDKDDANKNATKRLIQQISQEIGISKTIVYKEVALMKERLKKSKIV